MTAPAPRPSILTADHDPGVSLSAARDLRRRYGRDHRVVRAESGAQASTALRELKPRGDQVTVLLADHRMPEMTGIESRASDGSLPLARRVLLIADTDAAIRAIDAVDLDQYSLKPWDPPKNKLCPVPGDLLAAWRASDHRPVTETEVVGHRWSARSRAVRDFLARNPF